MSVQVEKLEKNMAKLTVEVPAENVEKAIQGAYNKMKKSINIPGFRKGKAPRQLIEKMYGKEVFYNDAIDAMLPAAYSDAVEECGEEIVSHPQIDVVQIESGKPFVFTATVAVKPAVELGEYKGIQVEKAPIEVKDEEIEAQITKEREANSRTVTVDDRAVAQGDIVTLDFEGFVDGVAFEGGKGENYDLTIGSNTFIPGFEDQLVGAEIGKELDVNVTFPEEYGAKELAGKAAVFKCKVNGIKVKELPAVDDEFAQEVSEFDTLDEYKADIKAKLLKEKEDEAARAKEDAVIGKIIEGAKMEIPDAMVEYQTRQMLDEFAQRIQSQGISLDQYFQFTGLTEEKYMEEMKPRALQNIQSRLVLEAVAQAENLVAEEADIEEEIKKMADMYKMEADKIKELLGERQMEEMKKDIAVQKAAKLVAEAAVEA
ncbi:trigger factor [Clostridiaceae bacterium AM27-36LB]|nr:trigger factor [Clostridiales bacterium AM23-16LB]RHR46422.1 trigger factor [Clostridiaceae bacterium AF18-31LB]RHT80401.1 trigger factor [Clostridiaceae bacterium AM27-36LB]RHW02905.1 trigger factor [Clostridiaceae bacterium OF09-1]